MVRKKHSLFDGTPQNAVPQLPMAPVRNDAEMSDSSYKDVTDQLKKKQRGRSKSPMFGP